MLTAMIWLSVRDNHIVQLTTTLFKLSLQGVHVKVTELLMGSIDETGLLAKDEERVVCSPLLKAKFDVESVTIPVKRSDADCFVSYLNHLYMQTNEPASMNCVG